MMEHFPINAVDIGALLVVCLSTLRGFHRGLSGELAQLISVVAALILGVYTRKPFGSWLLENTHLSNRSAHALAFVLTVVAVILAMVLLGFVFRRIMKVVFEEGVDKPGGGLAGFASGTLVAIIVFMIMNMWPHEYLNRQFGEESIIGRVVVKWTPTVQDKADELPASKKIKKEIKRTTDL
jgi:uncharacterized membrane protein required for colicin V production